MKSLSHDQYSCDFVVDYIAFAGGVIIYFEKVFFVLCMKYLKWHIIFRRNKNIGDINIGCCLAGLP